MTPPTKPDSICQMPDCGMPVLVGYPFCPRHLLAHDQLAEVAAGETFDIQVVSVQQAAEMVTRGFTYVSAPFLVEGREYACIALDD